MREASPVIRPVTPEEAKVLSPWPERLAGTTAWERAERTPDDLNREFDQDQYSDLDTEWKKYVATLSLSDRHPGSALRFFDERRRGINAAAIGDRKIYGSIDTRQYLISLSDRLYAGDLNLMEAFWRTFIVERAALARDLRPYETVLEIGCGSGATLLDLYARLGLDAVSGCDVSQNAVSFLRTVSDDLNVEGTFEVADYHDGTVLRTLGPASGRWALLSVHALMYAQGLGVDWFREVVDAPNPPAIAIHFEPLVWDDESHFAEQCERYAKLNRYNTDFLYAARAAEAQGLVEIVHSERRPIGHSAYSPTSVLMWVPRSR